MITENLSTLKIHRLTQEQYDRELASGRIDENALYLTPDEGVDLSQYATASDLKKLETLVGDTPVSEQIKEAVGDISGAVKFDDVYNTYNTVYSYTWDGTTADRNSFTLTATHEDEGTTREITYYKVSDDIPYFLFDAAGVRFELNDGQNATMSTARNDEDILFDNCYEVGCAIIVEYSGSCTIRPRTLTYVSFDDGGLDDYRYTFFEPVTFKAPSPGIYFPHFGTVYLSKISTTAFMPNRKDILVTGMYDEHCTAIGIGNGRVLEVRDKYGRTKRFASEDYVDEQIAEAIVDVYVQDEAPADAPEGSLWIDIDDEGLPNTPENAEPSIHVVDAKTSDISQVDFTEYKIGDIVLVTLS